MSSPSRAQRRHPERYKDAEPTFPATTIAWMHPGETAGGFTNFVFDVASYDGAHNGILRRGGSIRLESSPRLAASRNMIVREFLKTDPSVKYLAFFDADMTGNGDAVYQLLKTAIVEDAGITGGLCFVGGRGQRGMYPTIYVLADEPERRATLSVDRYSHYPKGGVLNIDATGGAAMVIRRDVLEKMAQKYARSADGRPNPMPWFEDGTHMGQEYGEDVVFCLRARLLGFRVVVDTNVKFGHMKTMELNEELYELHLALTGQPALKSTEDAPDAEGFFDIAGPLELMAAEEPEVTVEVDAITESTRLDNDAVMTPMNDAIVAPMNDAIVGAG